MNTTAHHHNYIENTEQIEVTVTPLYVEEKSNPAADYYFFAYNIAVENLSDTPVRLLSRQWIIRDGAKAERYVNGEGVVGQKPFIPPGEIFRYTSFCPLSTPTGNMRGKFEMEDNKGNRFWVRVPVFFFRLPESFTIQ
jgi:ApaG protein